MIDIIYFPGLILLLAMSAFFALAEVGIVGIPYPKVHKFAKEGRWGAQSLRRLKQNLRGTIITIIIGNNIVNIVLSSVSTLLAIEAFGSVGVGLAIGVISLLVLTFGEVFPKTFATAHMEKAALYSAPLVEMLSFILSPFVLMFRAVPDVIFRTSKEHSRVMVTETEIHDLMELGMDENVLEKNEVGMIKRVLLFNDIPVKSIITPIERVAKLSEDATVEEAIKQVSIHDYTRYPLVDSTGRITGSLRVKNLFHHAYDGKDKKVLELADKPLFMDGEVMIDDAFGLMKKEHAHIAYITDPAGKVTGIATTEDVLEEIVGEF
jgi:CBS domain containing-hemolysin-like protein